MKTKPITQILTLLFCLSGSLFANFVDCCFINLNELYQLSERGTVGKGTFDGLNEWSFFFV